MAAVAIAFATGVWIGGQSVWAEDAPTAADGETPEKATETEQENGSEPGSHDVPPEGHEGGAHHDPHDLSQANATAKLEDPTEWRYDMAICTFVVFLVLLLLLRVFAWGPLMTGLQRRESAIAARIEEAERNVAESASQLQAYREKMAAAAQERQEIIAQARRDAEGRAEKIREEARNDVARERQRALAEIQNAKNAALRDVAEKGADMAVLLAGRIVRRELTPRDHAELISETLGKFPSTN